MPTAPPQLPGSNDPNVLWIIDLPSWVHRTFHATQRGGEDLTAALTTVALKLANVLRKQEPVYLVAAVESNAPTWRHALYPGYKADRPTRPDDLTRLLILAEELFILHQIPVLRAEGCEADDVIATMVRRAMGAEMRVVVIGVDKDLMQLVSRDVLLWDGKDKLVDVAAVEEKFGVGPSRIGDLLALAGDSTDGVPGIDGVGIKGAADLLKKRGTLANVLDYAYLEKQALRAKLTAGTESARLSRKLVTLKDDASVRVRLDDMRVGWDSADMIRAFYQREGVTSGMLLDVTNMKPIEFDDEWLASHWLEG